MAIYGYDDALNKVEVNDKATTDSELAGKVPTSRTINGKRLTGNISLTASDIGVPNITISEFLPSGGEDGDIWIVY